MAILMRNIEVQQQQLMCPSPVSTTSYLTLSFPTHLQIKVLNDSRDISLTLYLSSIILLAIVIISFVFKDHLNIYSASYCFGVPLSNAAVLIVVFFTKVNNSIIIALYF